MASDPAVLWYWSDWFSGTCTLSRAMKGAYMDLLHANHNNDTLSLDEIKTVLGSDFGAMWPTLQKKFVKDDNGLYHNKRGRLEKEKRRNFSKSRKKNLLGSDHMEGHMENENGIEDLTELRKLEFISKVNASKLIYSDEMIKKFCDYWTEKNATGKRMRFEMEKTFEIPKRLAYWASRSDEFKKDKKEFPDTFDKKIYFELQNSDQAKFYRYQEHLRSLGLAPRYNTTDSPMKGTLLGWFKPVAA